ncbi:MAG: hypothetical protein U0136_08335 [Bdellovibrionota bacterium]
MPQPPASQSCRNCGSSFALTARDRSFYEAIQVPHPTWCPDCRMLRRMAHCNEGALYPGNCSQCSKRIISQYAPGARWPVLCVHCWWSQNWNAESFGREPDFTRPFFEQFRELEMTVPHACVSIDTASENCDYTHHAGNNRNCYFIFHASQSEDYYYGYGVKRATSCVDVHNCFVSELCYECVDVDNCYDVQWSQDCFNCSSSRFIRDCIGCQNCFLSVGLRNKSYYFLNEQLTRAEYERRLASLDLGSHAEVTRLKEQFRLLQSNHVWRDCQVRSVENSTGNYLINAKDSFNCFDCRDAEQCRYCAQLQLGSRTSYDIYQFGIDMELCYEGAMIGANAYNVHFGVLCITSVSNLSYCIDCYSSSDSLLCFGLRNAKYCILNRAYDKHSYEALRERIIAKMTSDGEYGEFFPVSFSQFGYNETTAHQWFPLTREEVIAKGWAWRDELRDTRGKETIQGLPDNIREAPDSFSKEVLACDSCERNYRVTAQELAYYRRSSIPVPRLCFPCRRQARAAQRNPRELHSRECSTCGAPIMTPYNPTARECVCCEACYTKALL